MLFRSDREVELSRWAAQYAATLESWVRSYPEQWFQFHDPWGDAPAQPRLE